MQKFSLIFILYSCVVWCGDKNEPVDPHPITIPSVIPTSTEEVDEVPVHSPRARERNNVALNTLRNTSTQEWANRLKSDSVFWYHVGKKFDALGQFCTYATPLCSALAAALQKQELSIAATVMGVSAVAAHRMGRYASNESTGRMAALNRIFAQEGVPPGVVIGDGSSNGSNGE